MRKNWFWIFFLFLMASPFCFAEEEPIEFSKPEPYVDYEFEELQRTFLRNRKIQLAALKNLPLTQYPEEFILDLIQQLKSEVKKEVEENLYKYLSKVLERKQIQKKPTKTQKEDGTRKQKKPSEMIRMEVPKEKIEKQKKKEEEEKEKASREEQEKARKVAQNQIVRFSLNNNTSFIGINALTKLMMNVEVKAASNVSFVDVSIYVKNLATEMVYLLKRFPFSSIKNSKSFSFYWEYPNIPFGKYKPYVIARFYDQNRRQISQDFQFWGNSSSPKIYILFKN